MNTNGLLLFTGSFAGGLLALLAGGIVLMVSARPWTQWLIGRFIRRIMKDRYAENIWEMVTALTRTSPRIVVENSLRAEFGEVIERPFGTPRRFLNFDGLIFSPAQLARLPTPENVPVDVSVTIGPKARRPLRLQIPLMAGGMAFGIGLSERVRIALAQGTAAVGTSTNSGEGPMLPEERELAAFYILQYGPGHWSRNPEALRRADAVEIYLGRGANAGAAIIIPPGFLGERARQLMGVEPGEKLVVPSLHPDIRRPGDLTLLVDRLRSFTGGVPIGVKLAAGGMLEADLEVAIRAEVDFISLDGAQGGTKGAAPILQDDFGLPTVYALPRAVEYLRKRGVKDRISLLVGGGFNSPGDCLKALALGADAVYMGTALLWAMTHDQITKAVPWEPPTELAFDMGRQKDEYDPDAAAQHLARFLKSCVEEIKVAIRALGKTSLSELSKDDLAALDELTARVTRVPLVFIPTDPTRLAPSAKQADRGMSPRKTGSGGRPYPTPPGG